MVLRRSIAQEPPHWSTTAPLRPRLPHLTRHCVLPQGTGPPVVDVAIVSGDSTPPEGFTLLPADLNKGGTAPSRIAMLTAPIREGELAVHNVKLTSQEKPPSGDNWRRVPGRLNPDGDPVYLWLKMDKYKLPVITTRYGGTRGASSAAGAAGGETAEQEQVWSLASIKVGDAVDCEDAVGHWRAATVLDVIEESPDEDDGAEDGEKPESGSQRKLRIRYNVWPEEWAVTLPAGSPRIAPPLTHISEREARNPFVPVRGTILPFSGEQLDEFEKLLKDASSGRMTGADRDRFLLGELQDLVWLLLCCQVPKPEARLPGELDDVDDEDGNAATPAMAARMAGFFQAVLEHAVVPALRAPGPLAPEWAIMLVRMYLGDPSCQHFFNIYARIDGGTPAAEEVSGAWGRIPPSNACAFFVANMNFFGRLGGFVAIQQRMERTGADALPLDIAHNLIKFLRTQQFCYADEWKAASSHAAGVYLGHEEAGTAAGDPLVQEIASGDDRESGDEDEGDAEGKGGEEAAAVAEDVPQASDTYWIGLYRAWSNLVATRSDDEIVAVGKASINTTRNDFKLLFKQIMPKYVVELVERLDLVIHLRFVRCRKAAIRQRSTSLDVIADKIKAALYSFSHSGAAGGSRSRALDRMDGFDVDRSIGSLGRHSYSNPMYTRGRVGGDRSDAVDLKMLAGWLNENRLVDYLLDPEMSAAPETPAANSAAAVTTGEAKQSADAPLAVASEFICRMKPLFTCLASFGMVTDEHLRRLWVSCGPDATPSAAVFEIARSLVGATEAHLDLPRTRTLFDLVAEAPMSAFDETYIELVRDITEAALILEARAATSPAEEVSAPDDETAPSTERKYGLAILWSAVQDGEHGGPPSLSGRTFERALATFTALLQRERRPTVLTEYLEACAANIYGDKSVPQSLRVLQDLQDAIALDTAASDQTTRDFIELLVNGAHPKYSTPLVQRVVDGAVGLLESTREVVTSSGGDSCVIGADSYAAHLEKRLAFACNLVRSAGEAAFVSFEQVQTLWEQLVAKSSLESDRNTMFSWLRECLDGDARDRAAAERSSQCFTDEVTKRIFGELLCSDAHMGFATMGREAFDCFETVFRWVNGVEGRIHHFYSKEHFVVADSELVGLPQLWQIAMANTHPYTAKAASQFLINVHVRLSLPEGSRPDSMDAMACKKVWGSFVRQCMDMLREHVAQLSSDDASVASKAVSAIAQVVSFLSRFLAAVETAGRRRAVRRAHETDVTIHVQDTEARVEQSITLPFNTYTDCVPRVRDIIAQEIDWPANKLRLRMTNRLLHAKTDASATLQDCNMMATYYNQFTITATKLKEPAHDTVDHVITVKAPTLPEDSPRRHPRQILANDQKYFDLLFEMLSVANESVVQDAWDLLRSLPTNARVLNDVQTLGGVIGAEGTEPSERGFRAPLEGEEFDFDFDAVDAAATSQAAPKPSAPADDDSNDVVDWERLLDGTEPIKLLYSLRIITSIALLDVDDEASTDVLAFSKRWKREFLVRGGFAHLAGVLASLDVDTMFASYLPKSCLQVLLHIICAFHRPAVQAGVAGAMTSGDADSAEPLAAQVSVAERLLALARAASLRLSTPSSSPSASGGAGGPAAADAAAAPDAAADVVDDKHAEQTRSVLRDSLVVLVSMCGSPPNPPLWLNIAKRVEAADVFVGALLRTQDAATRADVARGVKKLVEGSRQWAGQLKPQDAPLGYFIELLNSHLPSVADHSNSAQTYFYLFSRLVRVSRNSADGPTDGESASDGEGTEQGEVFAGTEADASTAQGPTSDPVAHSHDPEQLGLGLARFLASQPVREESDKDVDPVARGVVSTLISLVRGRPQIKRALAQAEGGNLISMLFERGLFAQPAIEMPSSRRKVAVATTSVVLPPPVAKSKGSRKLMFKLLSELARDCPQNASDLVSLVAPHHDKSFEKPKPRRSSYYWSVYDDDIDGGRSATGYSGLENLGCICYLNASLQQFFHVAPFARGLLSFDDPAEDPKDSVMFQLQNMFAHLLVADQVAFNPKSFCNSFKDWDGNPINVAVQQDAYEFLQQLFQKLEASMMGTPHSGILKACFSINLTQELISDTQYKERVTPETFLSLTVKGRKSLQDSLDELLEGEDIDDYKWDQPDGTRVEKRTRKRAAISSCPPHLIVHLKRFEYDLSTMRQVKLNDRYEFPRSIDLFPYTTEGRPDKVDADKIAERAKRLAERKEGVGSATGGEVELDSDAELEEEESDQAGDEESKEPSQPLKRAHPDDYYVYDLYGIVIHSGFAEGGHYYSYIRDRNSDEERWLEFNDRRVSPFDPRDIDREAFGGSDSYGREKTESAFILIYDRRLRDEELDAEIAELSKQKESEDGAVEERASGGGGGAAPTPAPLVRRTSNSEMTLRDCQSAKPSPKVSTVLEAIHDKNLQGWRRRNILDADYFNFMWQLYESASCGVAGDDDAELGLAQLALRFVSNTLPHGPAPGETKARWIEALRDLVSKSAAGSVWLLRAVTEDATLLVSLLSGDSVDQIAALAATELVGAAVEQLAPEERPQYGDAAEVLGSGATALPDRIPDGFTVVCFVRRVASLLSGPLRKTGTIAAAAPVLTRLGNLGPAERRLIRECGVLCASVDALLGARSPVSKVKSELSRTESGDFDGERDDEPDVSESRTPRRVAPTHVGDDIFAGVDDMPPFSSSDVWGTPNGGDISSDEEDITFSGRHISTAGDESQRALLLGPGYGTRGSAFSSAGNGSGGQTVRSSGADHAAAFELLSMLVRATLPPSNSTTSIVALDGCEGELSPLERSVLLHETVLVKLLKECGDMHRAGAVAPLLTHLCWDDAMVSMAISQHIQAGIEAEDGIAQKPYFLAALMLLLIEDSVSEERTRTLMEGISAAVHDNRQYYHATNAAIMYFVRLVKRSERAAAWTAANTDEIAWMAEWVATHVRPPTYMDRDMQPNKPGSVSFGHGVERPLRLLQDVRDISEGNELAPYHYDSDDDPTSLIGMRCLLVLGRQNERVVVTGYDSVRRQHRVRRSNGDERFAVLKASTCSVLGEDSELREAEEATVDVDTAAGDVADDDGHAAGGAADGDGVGDAGADASDSRGYVPGGDAGSDGREDGEVGVDDIPVNLKAPDSWPRDEAGGSDSEGSVGAVAPTGE